MVRERRFSMQVLQNIIYEVAYTTGHTYSSANSGAEDVVQVIRAFKLFVGLHIGQAS